MVTILGPIRKDSDEGQMGRKAINELKTLSKLIDEMTEKTYKSAATLHYMNSNASVSSTRNSVVGVQSLTLGGHPRSVASSKNIEDCFNANRRSICIS